MSPLLRRAIKVCRQEGVVPPSVEIKMSLRHARKVRRQESGEWVPPHPMRGATVLLQLEQMIRIAYQYRRRPNFFNFKVNINMATAKYLY